ncbi:ferritin-like protein [Streptomyces sp. 2132.2]|nr:ferritin-like protein [Streptomyces sp. 2132.2]
MAHSAGGLDCPCSDTPGPSRTRRRESPDCRHRPRGCTPSTRSTTGWSAVRPSTAQLALVDAPAERVQSLGGVAVGDPRHVAELTSIPRPPDGVEPVPVMLSHLLEAHEAILIDARDAAARISAEGDEGSNDLLISEVVRTGEAQVWFLAEHLVDTPWCGCGPKQSADRRRHAPGRTPGRARRRTSLGARGDVRRRGDRRRARRGSPRRPRHARRTQRRRRRAGCRRGSLLLHGVHPQQGPPEPRSRPRGGPRGRRSPPGGDRTAGSGGRLGPP